MRDHSEAGFSLLETSVVTTLVALGVGGLLQALIIAGHAQANIAARARVQASARNLITDMSAATAYESAAQGPSFSLSGAVPVQMPQPVPSATPVAISCLPAISAGILTVVCRDPDGDSATAQAYVGQRAPAPGSTVQYLPAPSWTPG